MSETFLAEVRGHDRARAHFRAITVSGRIPTGLLLYGPDGVGKRLFATRWVAHLLCPVAAPFACGVCESCHKVATAMHPDLEIVEPPEGKDVIPIDLVRRLREWFSLTPFQARRRCALIDEAHRMSVTGQNALLKLLEEPPGDGLLLVVTSEPGKLLETIRSRMQRVHFGPLSEADIAAILDQLGIEADVRDSAVALSKGSAGRAIELAVGEAAVAQEAAATLLDVAAGPFGAASDALPGKGGATDRGAARNALDAALSQVRAALRGKAAAGTLEGVPADVLVEVAEGLLEARGRINGYVSPRAVLEAEAIRIRRRLITARRRR